MCARLKLQITKLQLENLNKGIHEVLEVVQNINTAPTELASIIALDNNGHWKVRSAVFGLIPHWAKSPEDVKGRYFNARLETVDTLRTFKPAYEKRHCLIPCTGFYEWKGHRGDKQPYLIQRNDEEPLMLAGLWERWKSDEKEVYSFTILTTEPNNFMEEYHNRMPVMLSNDTYEPWLANEVLKDDLELLTSDDLIATAVDRALNNPTMKNPTLLNAV